MVSTARYAAVLALLAVGLLCAGAGTTGAPADATYAATHVDPATDGARIATADPDLVDFDDWTDGVPDSGARALREALRDGTYEGSVPPELYVRLDDHANESVVGVSRGDYYRLRVATDGDTTDVALTATALAPETAAHAVATPYADADPTLRRAIANGTATADGFVAPGLVQRGGDYYVVEPANGGALVGRFAAAIGAFLLRPPGYAYVAAAFAILAGLRARRTARPLDGRSALGVAAATVALIWVGTTLTGSGSLGMRYVVYPILGAVAALGLLAGLLVRRGSWARLAALTVLTPLLGAAASAVALGVPGVLFGALALVCGWSASLPLVAYGYAFGADGASAD